MRKTPTFSIVIPTHRRPALLNETIRSVLNQSYCSFECFVVSDYSPEFQAIHALIKGYSDPRLRFLGNTTPGANASRNRGLDEASGDVVAFLDDDDLWAEDNLEARARLHDENTFVYSNVATRFQGRIGYDRVVQKRHFAGDPLTALFNFKWCPATSSCVSISRELISGVQWDESLQSYQDWDYWVRVLERKPYICYIDRPTVIFRQHFGPRVSRGFEKRISALSAIKKKYPNRISDQVYEKRILTECYRALREDLISNGFRKNVFAAIEMRKQYGIGMLDYLRQVLLKNPESRLCILFDQVLGFISGNKRTIDFF